MIDYVFPYVDSADPIWQETYNIYCDTHKIKRNSSGNEKARFRDWGNLIRFVFRSIDTNMPWIHNIFFIVQSPSQIPQWLDTSKVKVVFHEDFIPKQYLPTYNSTTIEMFLWNIPELSEQFIYGNDDLFATALCDESDFFSKEGLPRFHLSLASMDKMNAFRKTIVRGQSMIHEDFPEFPIPEDKYYRTGHLMSPMLKSTCQKVYEKHSLFISRGISNFRTATNVNQYIYSFYQMFSGQYEDVRFPGKYLDFKSSGISRIGNIIKKGAYKVVCVNDSNLENESEGKNLYRYFLEAFSKRSKYEHIVCFDEAIKGELSRFKTTPFMGEHFSIMQLKSENYNIDYVPQHNFPWLVSVPRMHLTKSFAKLSELVGFCYEKFEFLKKVFNTLVELQSNNLFIQSEELSLSYDNFSISKEGKIADGKGLPLVNVTEQDNLIESFTPEDIKIGYQAFDEILDNLIRLE